MIGEGQEYCRRARAQYREGRIIRKARTAVKARIHNK